LLLQPLAVQRGAGAVHVDFEVSRYCYPSISTVAVDPRAIGRIAGEMLLAAAAARKSGLEALSEKRRVEFQVVVREST
jgi:LacI family gluconate utilization system Gnt-I transcriptional repressor